MKRSHLIALTFSALILSSSVLFSQENRSVGLKGGISFSNFWGGSSERLNDQVKAVVPGADPTTPIWFTVSAFSSHDILPSLVAIQSELVYTREGRKWKKGDDLFGFEIDYLRLPFLLKFSLPLPLKPSIYVGPQISFMFRSVFVNAPFALDTVRTGFFSQIEDLRGKNIERYTNVVDLGFASGLEFATPFGPGNAILDLRYDFDALNTFNFPGGGEIRNFDFLIFLGYALTFGGI